MNADEQNQEIRNSFKKEKDVSCFITQNGESQKTQTRTTEQAGSGEKGEESGGGEKDGLGGDPNHVCFDVVRCPTPDEFRGPRIIGFKRQNANHGNSQNGDLLFQTDCPCLFEGYIIDDSTGWETLRRSGSRDILPLRSIQ